MDQVTLVLLDPLTVALMVVDCPPFSDAEVGETETDTSRSVTVADAVLVGSAALVAFIVIV